MSTRKVIIYKGKLYFSDVTVPTRVSQLANDAGYVTTDEKVKQTPTTEDAIYRILLSGDADDTEHVNKVFKNANLTYNPSTSQLKLSKTYIGNILANITADPKYLTIQQYVNNVSIGYLQLNFNDIYNDNKWDGTNTSLKSSITSIAADTGWQTVTSSYCDIKVRKIGKVVELVIWSDKAIPASQQIAKLADAYKPVIPVYPNRIYLRNSISTASDITLRIENDGTIYNTGNANIAGHWVVIHATWTSYPLPS